MFNPYQPGSSTGVFKLADDLLTSFAHRGLAHDDLAHNRASAEARLQQLDAVQVPPSARAQASLECGIACFLQGETLAAFRRFKHAAGAASHGGDAGLYLVALCYGLHCLFLTYYWAAGMQTVPADEMDPLYDMQRALPFWVKRIIEVEQLAGWSSACPLRRLLEQQRAAVSHPLGSPQQLQMAQRLEWDVEHLAPSSGVPFQTTAPLVLEMAGFHRRASRSSSHAEAVVRQLQRKYSDAGDVVGMAHCEVKLGDFASAPAGPPEYWGSTVRPGLDSGVSEPLAGSSGPPAGLDEIEDAAYHYEDARLLFEQAGFRRGLATVELRQSYLATLRARNSGDDTLRHRQEALRHCNSAKSQFEACGDVVAFQTARAHSIMCLIALGQRPEDTASARDIGTWGRTEGSISYTMGLGLFLAAQARRWTADDGEYERGVAAFRLAEALFDGLGLARSCAAAIVDQMSVHDMLGEHDRFVIASERVLKMYTALCETAGSSSLASWARTRAVNVLDRTLRRAIEREDADGISRAVSRLRRIHPLRPHPSASQSATVEALSQLIRKMDLAMSDPSSCPDAADVDVNVVGEAASAQTTETLIDAAEFQELMFRAKRARRDGDTGAAQGFWDRAEAKAQHSGDRHIRQLLLANVAAARNQDEVSASHLHAYCESRLKEAEERARRSRRFAPDVQQLFEQDSAETYAHVFPGLVRVKRFGEAEDMLDALVRVRGNDWWKVGDAVANLTAAAEVKEGQAKFTPAWKLYQQAIGVFEDRRGRLSLDEYKLSLAGSSRLQGLYFKAARTAVKWHYSLPPHAQQSSQQLADAFQALERGKTRSLLDLMAAGSLMYGRFGSSELDAWDEYRRIGASLAAKRGMLRQQYASDTPDTDRIETLEADITRTEARLGRQEERLFADESPSARRFVTQTDVSDIDTLRSQLDDDTVVLQYSYRGDDLIAWAVTTDGMAEVHHRSVSEAELELHARRFRDQCQRAAAAPPSAEPREESHLTDGQWLADLLFPFKTAMDKFHLIIVAYRALHTLPFHALPVQHGPLLASHSVVYLPSASCISYLQPSTGANVGSRVLTVGNPSNMGYEDVLSGTKHSLGPLPFAETEARTVYRVSGAESRCLVGAEATRDAVAGMIGEFDILHFATHGLLCSEVPMMSSVALADGEQLTVGELLGRRLRASLAVLSACDTGVGQATDGDDMVGFARSLLAAGVQAIVVSLWPVNDLVTSVLMGEFHRRLQRGQPGSAALRDAQLAARKLTPEEMERRGRDIQKGRPVNAEKRSIAPQKDRARTTDYSHPRFWAPFIFIGVG